VITACRYEPNGSRCAIAVEDISEVHGLAGGVLWVDVHNPTDADLDTLQEEFSLHPLAIEDARNHGQRPKLEMYPTHAFIVVYSAEIAEVDLFVGPHWLVCVRELNSDGVCWEPGKAIKHFERSLADKPTVGNLLHAVLDDIVDGYFDAFDVSEDVLEDLEDQIFGETPAHEQEVQHRLYDIRRRLVKFRRHIVPMREVMNAILRKEVPWIDDASLLLMRDVEDHVLRAIDLVDSARDLMGNAVDAHLSIISNRMNVVMKKMTSWGAILFGASLIAGIYGMNFVHMPELRWYYGYPMALGLMGIMTLVLYKTFKRRDWL
jgi:magnesium transporter